MAEERLSATHKALAPLLANLALSLHVAGRGTEAYPLVHRALATAEESGESKNRKLIGIILNALGTVLSGECEFGARRRSFVAASLCSRKQTGQIPSSWLVSS